MNEVHRIIQERQSARVPFDPNQKVSKEHLLQILDAGRWAPTAHNMQNFDVVVVDDKEVLEIIGNVKSRISEVFLRENYQQLSFSKDEFITKRVGLLGTMFPESWQSLEGIEKVVKTSSPSPLSGTISNSPTILIVLYDAMKRAPASEGDFLGKISLGTVMENMWIMSASLGIGFR